MLVERTMAKKSFGNLTLLLCKTWTTFCYCFGTNMAVLSRECNQRIVLRCCCWFFVIRTRKSRPSQSMHGCIRYETWRSLSHVWCNCRRPSGTFQDNETIGTEQNQVGVGDERRGEERREGGWGKKGRKKKDRTASMFQLREKIEPRAKIKWDGGVEAEPKRWVHRPPLPDNAGWGSNK